MTDLAFEGSKTVSADLAAGGIYSQTEPKDEEDPKSMERYSNKEHRKEWFGRWYAFVLIAMYNVWELIGRYIPLFKSIKLESRKGLMAVIVSRFLLVPAFYFTSKYGDQEWMIFLTSFLGLTNGYLTVCVFTSAPKGYKGPEQNALGNILVLFLLGGIFAGVTLDWLWLIG